MYRKKEYSPHKYYYYYEAKSFWYPYNTGVDVPEGNSTYTMPRERIGPTNSTEP